MTFSPSLQQQLFDAIASGDHNILVDAKAGVGKTTTIVEGMKYVRKAPDAILQPDIVFLAFNKNIAETLKSRCPNHVLCSTFHALGFRALRDSGSVAKNVRVEGNKSRKLVWNATDRDDPDVQSIIRLINVAKGEWPTAFGNTTWWNTIIRRHDFLFNNPKRAIEVATSVILQGLKDRNTIDFADMLFLPVYENVPFSPRDWIFVDEAQDLNGVQHEIIYRLQHKIPEDDIERGLYTQSKLRLRSQWATHTKQSMVFVVHTQTA